MSPDASSKAVRAAYDWVRANRSEASGSYRLAVEAYTVLSDPVARAAYDLQSGQTQTEVDLRTDGDPKGHHPKHASIDVTGGHSWLGFLGRKR